MHVNQILLILLTKLFKEIKIKKTFLKKLKDSLMVCKENMRFYVKEQKRATLCPRDVVSVTPISWMIKSFPN